MLRLWQFLSSTFGLCVCVLVHAHACVRVRSRVYVCELLNSSTLAASVATLILDIRSACVCDCVRVLIRVHTCAYVDVCVVCVHVCF